MKACVLYSGGKDSSLMGVTLHRLGFDVELCTANFGVYDSYIPASLSAESLGFTHKVLNLDFEIHHFDSFFYTLYYKYLFLLNLSHKKVDHLSHQCRM